MIDFAATMKQAERSLQTIHAYYKENGVPIPPTLNPLYDEMLKGPPTVQLLLVAGEADRVNALLLTEFFKLQKDLREHLTRTQPAMKNILAKLDARITKLEEQEPILFTNPTETYDSEFMRKIMSVPEGRERGEALLREAKH
jgi:hypothetical protein